MPAPIQAAMIWSAYALGQALLACCFYVSLLRPIIGPPGLPLPRITFCPSQALTLCVLASDDVDHFMRCKTARHREHDAIGGGEGGSRRKERVNRSSWQLLITDHLVPFAKDHLGWSRRWDLGHSNNIPNILALVQGLPGLVILTSYKNALPAEFLSLYEQFRPFGLAKHCHVYLACDQNEYGALSNDVGLRLFKVWATFRERYELPAWSTFEKILHFHIS